MYRRALTLFNKIEAKPQTAQAQRLMELSR